jgi:murein DD-endopeptidase MepM/ murein hydrolase activator NlpD
MKKYWLTIIVICARLSSLSAQVEFANLVTPAATADLSTEFAKHKGRLCWPVDGYISVPFGNYTIDGKPIRGHNAGVTFSTSSKDEFVKAVFDGVVAQVDRGEIATIYVQHGKYYTIYSNLSGINVNKGDTVKTGEVIGRIGEAYSVPGGELTFILMVNDNNVNPALWLHH